MISSISCFGENNIKKLVALSTIGHIGLIVLFIGSGLSNISFFHLLRHSFFKCCLFIYSGIFLHIIKGNLDFRFYIGNNKHLSVFFCYILVGNISLICIPFSSGFFSKDIGLEFFLRFDFFFFFFFFVLLCVFFTCIYSLKFFFINCGLLNFNFILKGNFLSFLPFYRFFFYF